MGELIVGAILGGVISLVSAVAIDGLRSRREDQRRWDTDRLSGIIQLIGTAQELEGALYRRGRAVHDFPDPDSPQRLTREEEARQAMSRMWVAVAKASLLAPDVRADVERVRDTSRALNRTADAGFPSHADMWLDVRATHHAALEELSARAGERLGLVLNRHRMTPAQ